MNSKSNTKLHLSSIAAALSAMALAACGGGGSAVAGGDDTIALASITTGIKPTTTTTTNTTPTTTSTTAPTSPTSPTSPSGTATAGSVITDIRIQNTGASQTNVPFTFGQVFADGDLSTKDGLAAKLADGTVVPLQIDVKATHADGTVRHAVISGVLPSLAAGQTQTLKLAKSSAAAASTATIQSLVAAGLTSNVTITLNNVKYTASLNDAIAASTPINWLSGNVANEWIVTAPLKNASGAAHPMLTARFDVRWYSGLSKQARVEVVVENTKTFSTSASNLTYDVNVDVAGRSVYSKTALTHYHHARWHTFGWWDAAHQPATYLQPNAAYLIASKAVPNYDQTIVPAESSLVELAKSVTPATVGPMTIGPTTAYMGMTGGRGDIGPLPSWQVQYLLSMDKRAYDATMAAADGSGSWSVHLRDEATNYPLRTDNEVNKNVTTHPNGDYSGPLPVPRCVNDDRSMCNTPYADDTAHEPSLTFLPYLITGDYYYLEELQFWASWNPLGTVPEWAGFGKGLLRWQQVRGQAWSLRTLGQTAYITPDKDPMKAYFNMQMNANLDFYNQAYVVGNPNQLGVYDGSGQFAAPVNDSAPWQDDYLTWSFGYLSELGFTKAAPILQWKAKYPVGRMTAAGYCWIFAAPYHINFRDSASSPIYKTFAELYSANFSNTKVPDDGSNLGSVPGANFLDLPCGSAQQAAYLSTLNGYQWVTGRMIGFSESTNGQPSIMQPALAVAKSMGVPQADQAWKIFSGRAAKPNYSLNPQYDIVPR